MSAPPPPRVAPAARGAAAAARPLGGEEELARIAAGEAPRTVWDRRHADRIQAARHLRYAGLVVREEWSHTGGTTPTWLSGPCTGQAVVDPWRVYARLRTCCHTWGWQGTRQGAADLTPRTCGLTRVCPVCAAADSRTRGAELLPLADGRPCPLRDGPPGPVMLVSLTHRDKPAGAETLTEALERLESALDRVRRYPDSAAWLASTIEGACWTIEVTSGATGHTWHPHTHGIVCLLAGLDPGTWRAELADRWRWATELSGGPEWAWDRDVAEGAGGGRWAQVVSGPSQIFQATKYPATVATLGGAPERWAEWVTVTKGRRLVRWWGRWAADRGWRAWAEKQARSDADQLRAEREATGGAPPGGRPVGAQRAESDLLGTGDGPALQAGEVWLGQSVAWQHLATRERAWALCRDYARLASTTGAELPPWRIPAGEPAVALRAAAAELAIIWREYGCGAAPSALDLALALAERPV